VLDNEKRYWVGDDVVDKLLCFYEGWPAAHPLCEEITRRYLKHQGSLTREALARIVHAPVSAETRGWLSSLVRIAVQETEHGSAGGETMLAKLAELMFVEVIRKYIDGLPKDSRGWLSGLRDRHVGAALRLIHARPSGPLTLESLARDVGLSRSVFAERFAHFVGVPPMQYLARWRLQLAAHLLQGNGTSIAAAAAEVGYESEAAFNRAFKKFVGVPPGAWRRSHNARPAEAAPAA